MLKLLIEMYVFSTNFLFNFQTREDYFYLFLF